jgi:hypothetical protein
MPQLTLSVTASSASQSLTALGLTDWMAVHNPLPVLDFKSGGGATIGVSRYGGGGDAATGALSRTISWTDGTNFGTGSISDGVQNNGGAATGYEVTFPASTALRVAYVYLGGYSSTTKVTAIISDSSTGNQVDTTLTGSAAAFTLGYAQVIYQAAGSATLTVRVEAQSGLSSPGALVSGGAWGAYTAPTPTLTSTTTTSITASGATIGCTTDTASGTLYTVVTTSATQPSIAQIKAGQTDTGTTAIYANSQTVTTTGAKTATASGLAASTAYFHHWVHNASSLDSNRLTSASFTTSASGGGGVAPSITSSPSNQTVTEGATATFTASASGTPTPTPQWTRNGADIGGANSTSFTTGATTVSGGSWNSGDTLACRFTNASGTATTSSATLTVNASGTATVTIPAFTQWTGSPVNSITVPWVYIKKISDGSSVLALTNRTVDGSGNMTITSASLVAATDYVAFGFDATGVNFFVQKVRAT